MIDTDTKITFWVSPDAKKQFLDALKSHNQKNPLNKFSQTSFFRLKMSEFIKSNSVNNQSLEAVG